MSLEKTHFKMTEDALLAKSAGKGAVFIGAFLAYLSEHGDVPLRDAQTAGVDWVREQGGSISLNYVKTCCRNMQTVGWIEYVKSGRNFEVRLTDKGDHRFNNLPEDWGTKLDAQWYANVSDENQDEVKRRPTRRIRGGQRLDTSLWRAYMAAQTRGELDIIFVPAGSEVRVGARGRFSAYDPAVTE